MRLLPRVVSRIRAQHAKAVPCYAMYIFMPCALKDAHLVQSEWFQAMMAPFAIGSVWIFGAASLCDSNQGCTHLLESRSHLRRKRKTASVSRVPIHTVDSGLISFLLCRCYNQRSPGQQVDFAYCPKRAHNASKPRSKASNKWPKPPSVGT